MAQEKLELLLKVSKEQAIKDFDQVSKGILQVKKNQQELNAGLKEGTISQLEYTKQMAVQKIEMGKLNQAQTANAKIIKSTSGSMLELRSALALNKQAYQALSKEERENDEIGKKLLKTIQAQDKEHKELNESIGQSQANVGNYKAAILEAMGGTNLFTQAQGAMTKGMDIAKVGFGSLKMAMLTLPLLLIAAGLAAVFQWFSRTEEGAEKLKIITAALGAVMNILLDSVSAVGKSLFEAFSSPTQAIEDFGKIIDDFVLGRIELMMKGIKGFATAFDLAMKGDFLDAMGAAGEALLDFQRGINPVVMLVEGVGKAAIDGAAGVELMYDTAIEKSSAAIKLQERENKLLKDKRKFNEDESVILGDIEELKARGVLQTLSSAEREKALAEAIRLQNSLSERKIGLATEEYNIQKGRNALGDSDITDLEKESELLVNINNIRRSNLSQQKEMMGQLSGFQKQQLEAELKAAEDKKIRIKEENDLIAENFELLLEDMDEQNTAILENQIKRQEKQREQDEIFREEMTEYENYLYESSLETEEERAQASLDRQYEREYERIQNLKVSKEQEVALLKTLDEAYAADKKALDQEVAENKKKLDEATAIAQFSGVKDTLNSVADLLGKKTKEGKAMSAVAAGIDAVLGAQRAFNSMVGIPVIGPALGAAAGAAALLSGMKNVQKILSTKDVQPKKYEYGGWIGGKSHAAGGTMIEAEAGEFVVNKRAMANPQMASQVMAINSAGNGGSTPASAGITEERVAQIAASVVAAIPVNVVESDITNKQRKVTVRESKFSA